jgi:16S rRNA processing protein RimM
MEERSLRAALGIRKIWALAPVVQNPETSGDFITLARVVKTQGRHGEVAAEIHSDVPERFASGIKLFALSKENTHSELEVEDIWPHKGLLVLKFVGIDSMNDAEELIGAELQVPRSERAELDQGWTYVSDLIGCTVFDHSNGASKEIGRIEDVQFGAGEAPLLIVSKSADGGEGVKYDVPFAEAYLKSIDAEKREVRMNLPEGILEVNAPMTAEEKKHQSRSGKEKRKR